MIDFNNSSDNNRFDQYEKNQFGQPVINVTSEEQKVQVADYITKVYGWMFFGLALSAVVAYYVSNTPEIIQYLLKNTMVFWAILIGELILVGALVVRIQKMSVQTATLMFLFYAALNGLVFAPLLLIYTGASIGTTFAVTAGTFGVMSAYGYFTKEDLSSFGKIMFMGLIGLIIASIANIFLHSNTLEWIVTFIGIGVFVGLTAYDTQKIKQYALIPDEEMRKKGAIMGALALYLDFVNLFIFLLRIFGRRN